MKKVSLLLCVFLIFFSVPTIPFAESNKSESVKSNESVQSNETSKSLSKYSNIRLKHHKNIYDLDKKLKDYYANPTKYNDADIQNLFEDILILINKESNNAIESDTQSLRSSSANDLYTPQNFIEVGLDLEQKMDIDDIATVYKFATTAISQATKYATDHNLYDGTIPAISDNEADAYRHFIWSRMIAQGLRTNQADSARLAKIVTDNHEFAVHAASGITTPTITLDEARSIAKNIETYDKPRIAASENAFKEYFPIDRYKSSYMDLYNNFRGIESAFSGLTDEEAFNDALVKNRLVTDLGQIDNNKIDAVYSIYKGTGNPEPDKPDWYHFTMDDEDGKSVDIYLSDIGGSAGEATSSITAIAKRSDETLWKQYLLSGGIWTDTGSMYAYAPGQGGGGVGIASVTNEVYSSGQVSSATHVNTMGLPNIKEIQQAIDNKKNELLNKFYGKLGFDPTTLTNEQKKMLGMGVVFGIDDNLFFGLANKIMRKTPSENDYYFMRAKSFTDSVFTAAYTTAAVGSAIAAVRALETAGAAGAMALATAPTGVGGAALGTAAVTELAESALMVGVSFVSGKLATRSQVILKSSVAKLKETIGYKIRNISNDILDQMETVGGHTLEKHVSMTNNELINRAVNEGVDATSFADKSTAIECVQQNLRKNADTVEEWLKNSSNQNQLVVECNHYYEIGYGAQAGSQHVTTGLKSSKIFMVKDSTMDLGFKIITSYPIF